jgi:hypothetical protein
MVQSTQMEAAAPHAPGAVPPAHTPFEQQAPLHGWVTLQPVVQAWATLSQAAPDEQSLLVVQPQVPPPVAVTQAEPTPLPAQPWQLPPLLPQAVGSVPGAQLPERQQPPLQGCTGLQSVVQWCVERSQDCCAGQSAGPLQPQPPATQAVPVGPALQSMQAKPLAPQVGVAMPALQVPPSQQPPLQGCDGLHEVVQVWTPRSQARELGQSEASLQPQAPPPATGRQLPPAGLVEQGVHAPPEAPQVWSAVPETHTPLSQQPPWQGCEALQLDVHWCRLRSQARPGPQSAALLQPHTKLTHR